MANQVRKIARPSSPKLKAALENGSGEAVTAARAAVFPPWAAKAIGSAGRGDRQLLPGRKCRRRAIGQQCRHRNPDESVQSVPDQIEGRNLVGEKLDREQRPAGSDHPPAGQHFQAPAAAPERPRCASNPSVATVAYKFSPAAKLVATTAATICSAGIFIELPRRMRRSRERSEAVT